MRLPQLCLLGLFWATSAAAQAHHEHPSAAARDSGVARFLTHARDGTARFRDQREAVAAGYRLLGPDFPGMGEHWVHPLLTLQGKFDPAQPQVLTYARIGDEIRLVGVAYAIPLESGEAPPSFPGGDAWHDHTGTIDEESALLHQAVSGRGSGDGLRLAMLHAWIGLDNPAGPFASDNWALPFARQGLVPGARIPATAARALSLVSGGDRYHRQLFTALGRPSPPEVAVAEGVLAEARGRVVAWLREREDGGAPVSADELRLLSNLWVDAWTRIERSVRPEVAAPLRAIRGADGHASDSGHAEPGLPE